MGVSDAREGLSQDREKVGSAALRPVAEQWKMDHWDPGYSSCWRKAGLLEKMPCDLGWLSWKAMGHAHTTYLACS